MTPPGEGARSKAGGESQYAILKALLPYLWPAGRLEFRIRVAVALVFLVGAKLAQVGVPLVLARAVDALNVEGAIGLAVPVGLLLAYGAVRFLGRAFGELRDAIFSKVAQNAVRRVALATFRRLHALSLRFHLERQTGALGRAIDRGTKGIEFLLFFVLFSVLPTLIEIGLVAAILWGLFDWRFSAIMLATIAGYLVLTFLITEWRIKLRRRMNEADNESSTKALDSLINYETVKYFGNEEQEARRYDAALGAYERAAIRSRTSLSLLNSVQALIIALGLTTMMLLAADGVVGGAMTLGEFVMVNAYLLQIAMPLGFLGTVYREIKQSLTDIQTMLDLMGQSPEVADAPDARALAVTAGAITFENVDFAYDPRRPVLSGVSFTVPPGGRVAVVGPSGSGKTTLCRLLYRFYDVTGGRILIDGQDLREVTQASLRRAIGIVPQDSVLFNDSLYYNLAYGRPDASREEIEAAARLARIHDFVLALPEGYETMVGERGLKLSGGEKQRVAIGRAILKGPRILLFDEATSSLDTKTEREIQASLEEIARDHTALVIAHRLSTVVDADEILVLSAGEVVERGRHEDLLAAQGLYAEMWARQQKALDQPQKGEAPAAAVPHADDDQPVAEPENAWIGADST